VAINGYTEVKVFSVTKARDREALGEKIGLWLHARKSITIANCLVTQSSDREFHCLSIVLFLAAS